MNIACTNHDVGATMALQTAAMLAFERAEDACATPPLPDADGERALRCEWPAPACGGTMLMTVVDG